jgi:hypothetical protein
MRVEQFSHQISWFSHSNEDLAIESGASTIKNEDLAIKQYAHVQTFPNLAHVALFERKWARQKIAKNLGIIPLRTQPASLSSWSSFQRTTERHQARQICKPKNISAIPKIPEIY